jgi:hypothetical protein
VALKADVGGRVNAYTQAAAASLTYTPIADRAGIIRSVTIDNRSADDTWRLSIGGREIMAFRENSAGNQQLTRMLSAATSRAINFFDWCRSTLAIDPSIPVPQGLSAVLKSDGGATADLLLEVEEHDPGDVQPGAINHYAGSTFVCPLILSRAAAFPTAVATTQSLDTQISPAWFPILLARTPVPANWKVELLALFSEGGGVNTFSGAANHTSITKDLQLILNGDFLFSHNFPDGLMDFGNPAAAGSANAVITQRSAAYPPFQQSENDQGAILQPSLVLLPGNNMDVRLELLAGGDTTGGADYSKFLQVFVARVTRPSGV